MWELVKDNDIKPGEKLATIHSFDSLLNLGLSKSNEEGKAELGFLEETAIPEEIQALLEQREAARVARNWEEADRLREAISVRGYTLEDTKDGPKVNRQG
jgi:cysteinyl-tRNA synthetase